VGASDVSLDSPTVKATARVIPSGLSPKEKELFEELKKLRAETN